VPFLGVSGSSFRGGRLVIRRIVSVGVLAVTVALAAVSVPTAAEAAAQVYNPCQRLSAGQVKYPSYAANRVTFATAVDRSQSAVVITGCVRSGSGYAQEWQTTGFAGSKGFSAQNMAWEDTWKSPTGSFSFTEALGRSNPGTTLKYYTVNPYSRWGGERGPNYNQYFEGIGGESDENLWTYMNQGFYEQAAVINWNRYPDMPTVQGASFAIFFHAGNVPSAGCISTNLGTVVQLLKTNRPGDRIIMGAVDDIFTPYSSSPFGAITNKYAALGGPAYAGNPVSNEMYGLKNGGAGQAFQFGSIYHSPVSGTFFSTGVIRAKWGSTGYENGILGYPASDEMPMTRGARGQAYQNGSIYWGGSTGAHVSMGAIRAAWGSTGYEKGFLGYPTTDEIWGMAKGGIGQAYEGGSIYFTPATGAHISMGAIRSLWGQQGFEKGALGYPTTDEYRTNGAVVQDFQGGSIAWFGASGKVTLKG
jgi:L,D-peptidoglycan transpeptidase YkuD (ErfK/YbiS/YcfS/YnhG family)